MWGASNGILAKGEMLSVDVLEEVLGSRLAGLSEGQNGEPGG